MNKTNYHDISDVFSPEKRKIQVFHPSPVNIQRYTRDELRPISEHEQSFDLENLVHQNHQMRPMDFIVNNLVLQNDQMKQEIKMYQERIKKQQKL
jgi:hypothetical protein